MASEERRSYFPTLAGNTETAVRLGTAIHTGCLPHALLLCGASGSGRHTLARLLAAAANCERQGEPHRPLPCGSCRTCQRILADNYPDVKWLTRPSGRATVGVEELRLFREDMLLSATEAQHRFYIIEEAELMTPAAQNALLKVLEEPPGGVHILLLADGVDRMLSTIRSRVQTVRMARLSPQQLTDALRDRDPEAAARIARQEGDAYALLLAADGRLGRLLSLLGNADGDRTRQERSTVAAWIAALDRHAPHEALLAVMRELPERRDELTALMEQLLTALRDAITASLSRSVQPLFFFTRQEAAEVGERLGLRRLVALSDMISDAIEDNRRNVNIPTLLTELAIRMRTA